MNTRSPLRALAWKEAREIWPLMVGALSALGLLTLAMKGEHPREWAFALVLFVAPGLAAVFGGASIASENASAAWHFLKARAVGERMIVGVKVAAHAMGALVVSGAALGVAASLGLGEAGWCMPLQTTTDRAWMLGIGLVPAMFLVGVALSLLLSDGLTAVSGAVVVGALWACLVLLSVIAMAGSIDTAFAGLPWLVAALILGPIALLLGIAERRVAFPPRVVRTLAVALGVVFGAVCMRAMTGEPIQARAVLAGIGSVLAGPIVAGAQGGAVAFVAESGRTRAVVSLVDKRRVVSLTVLAAGTRPVGWSKELDAFIVEWPDGAQRAVSTMGEIRPLIGAMPTVTTDSGPFLARAGRLIRMDGAEQVVAFPKQGMKP